MPGHNLPSPQNQYLNGFLSPNLACLQETWTGKEKLTDGQEKTEEEEEEEEEVTNTPGHPKHDPEEL